MKIFEKDGKTNFVDDNNVFVGYDEEQSCCENAGYFFSHEVPDAASFRFQEPSDSKYDWNGWNFDPKFFVEHDFSERLDEGGAVTFCLVRESDGGEAYLTIYNSQNGYYGHGFEMGVREIFHNGTL